MMTATAGDGPMVKKIMTYSNWRQNEPSNYNSKEACAGINNAGLWYDDNCEVPTFVLCYNGN